MTYWNSYHGFLKSLIILAFVYLPYLGIQAQNGNYWQQEINYKMDVALDVHTNKLEGKQIITYTNNSPETLDKVFIHLYLNAFQPGSMMDERSRSIMDPDSRVIDRIYNLKENEIGYQQIKELKQEGIELRYEVHGTILLAHLDKPLEPGQSTSFNIEFEAQVPLQIRRTGRDNKEGIRYSMTQWYPKVCEYDRFGWHPTQYVGREFHGVWGDFEVNITLDSDYIVAATGTLQNADEIGYGYGGIEGKVKKDADVLTWKFKAENVHDFAWAADPDYTHTIFHGESGVEMHFFYLSDEVNDENWSRLPHAMDAMFSYLNKNNGQYPYERYSFIQGGDGGMEYPMATLITGERNYRSLVGVAVHELLHSWYQGVLATDETRYPWVDEGFTSYFSSYVINHLKAEGLLEGKPVTDPFRRGVANYVNFLSSGLEEPMSTLADHFNTNAAYGVSSYVKGGVFLHGLKYIIGEDDFNTGMLLYFDRWKFKHPEPYDFIQIMEEVSGMQLDWYLENMMNTLKRIDYGIESVQSSGEDVSIIFRNHGTMPMPVDFTVKMKDGNLHHYTIPLVMMYGNKSKAQDAEVIQALPAWGWTAPVYKISLPLELGEIEWIELDPHNMLPDTDRENDKFSQEEE